MGYKSKILKGIVLVMIILLIGIVNGFEFDNVKSDLIKGGDISQYGKIEITNAFGLGSTIASLELKDNSDYCITHCSAETEIIMFEDGILIDSVRFLNYIGDWSEKDILDYKFYINNEVYKLGTKVKAGTYKVKLEGTKNSWETIDWQITSQGKLINEFAVWTASLDVKLNAYYEFEGNLLNSVNNANLNMTTITSGGTERYTNDGIIGKAYNVTYPNDNGFMPITNSSIYSLITVNNSMNVWFNVTSGNYFFRANSGGEYYLSLSGNTYTSDGTLTDTGTLIGGFEPNEWNMLTITNNGTYIFMYMNGSLVDQGVMKTANAYNLTFGSINFNGNIDELGFWNRTLSASEISDLWNGGNGIMYNAAGILITNLNLPLNNTIQEITGVNISVNFTPVSIVLKNATYFIWHSNGTLFNQTNVLIPSTNITYLNINFTIGNYIWNVEGCGQNATASYCAFATDNRSFTWNPFKIISQTYTTPTTSGATNKFVLDLQTAGSQITLAYLNYNGTNYLGSINSTGNNYTLTKNQIVPGVSSSTNIPFYWNITTDEGDNAVSTSINQTINPISINETCTGMYTIANFTLLDEITKEKINAATQNTSIKIDLNLYTLDRTLKLVDYFHEYSEINPAAICINSNLSSGESYSLDIQVQYTGGDYSKEFYNIERYILNSNTISNNISLYDLNTSETQIFKLITRDTSYLPIDGALIKIERKYLENGSFFTTEIPKTDERGITSASLQLNSVIYNFYIYDAGTLISSFTNVLAMCQTPLVSQCEIDFNAFQSSITVPDYESGDDFNFTLGYNSTSKIVSSQFIIPSGEPSLVQLVVTSEDSLGTSVCSDSLTTSSGTLLCTIPSNFGNSTIMAKLYKDGVESGKGSIKLDQDSSDIFGSISIILALFVMLTLIGVGISDSPVITAVFIFIGVLILFALNLVNNTGFIGATASILFLAIVIILVIIKASKRS